MRKLLLILSLSLSAMAFTGPQFPAFASTIPNPNLPDLVEKILPGVVNISTTTVINFYDMNIFSDYFGLPQQRKQSSLGSGFIIDKEGHVLTNDHVVHDAAEVTVTLLDKRQFRAKIIGKDAKMDLALLQIRDKLGKTPENLQPVPLGDSEAVRIAESVFAVGNPFGLQHTVTVGIISAKNRTIGQGPFDNFLQTDASINPGNSGGPLFNLKGEVVGINTMIFSKTGQSGGVGFAIPVNEAKRLTPDLKRYGYVPRPWLGVLSVPLNPSLQERLDLATGQGVLIDRIVIGSPAHKLKLEHLDIIKEVDGTPVSEPYDVERALSKHKPTETAKLKILRDRKTLELELKLQEMPRKKGRLGQADEDLPPGII